MSDSPLTALISRVQDGDQSAAQGLLTRFRPLIKALCRGLPAHDSQDLEQELCIQLIRLAQEYGIDCILPGSSVDKGRPTR